MSLHKKSVGVIVAFASAALCGLIAIQIYLLVNALGLKRSAFRQNVFSALSEIVQKLETRDVTKRIFNIAVDVDQKITSKGVERGSSNADSTAFASAMWMQHFDNSSLPQIELDSSKVTFMLKKPQYVRLRLLDSLGRAVENLVDGQQPAGKHEIYFVKSIVPRDNLHFNFVTDSTSFVFQVHNGDGDSMTQSFTSVRGQRVLADRVMRELTDLRNEPLEHRISLAQLDSLVKQILQTKDIRANYAYGIVMASPPDSITFANQPRYKTQLLGSEFKSALFPNDIFADENHLAIFFPQQQSYLLKQISASILTSFVFIAALIVCFVYIVRTLFRQREFASRLVSFINNMTHEFKTPISTIALASESIANSKPSVDGERTLRYARMISDENQRMRNQVEKILEMAVLEEGDFELNKTAIDVHQLVENARQKIVLQAENRAGRVITNLNASSPVIRGDALHVANVIHNLLDNALKYSNSAPEISIATHNQNGGIILEISDNGIGLSKEDQQRVFDKYYRVPTGNLHDVKGFGLGLSYVKLMVEAHGGRVEVSSELGKGSMFRVWLPEN
jgi:two-component system phosphate regulon sensor histidine kinase PhoR